jgi:CheY-like chemotaxis protein
MISPTKPHLAPKNGASARAARSVRILLVDDNRDTLKFLSTILSRQGFVVLTAADLGSSLRLASEADFDLIISDIELPDGSGLELMRVVRSRRAIPGIALSGFSSPEDIAQSRAAGFALHLTKPVDFRRLEQAIEQLTTAAPVEAPITS